MLKLNQVIAGVVLALPLAVFAQSKSAPAAPAKSVVPTLSQVLDASGVSVSGAVDASYDYSDSDTAALTNRQFDGNANTFSLHQVNLTVSKDFGGGVGATVNTVLGDDVGAITGTATDDIDVTQGFISYTDGGVTVIGGRFVTLAGYEVINPAGNVNASRSLLFFNQPLVHTGVRSTLKLSDTLAVTLGLNNSGFGTGKTDPNTRKTVEAQLALTPSSAVGIFLTAYHGEGDGGPAGVVNNQNTANYVDLVASVALSDMLSVALNADYSTLEDGTGTQGLAGVAGYVNAKLSPKFRTSLRAEYLELDTGNTAGLKNAWLREVTLTGGYAVSSALEMLVEVRHDQSSENNLTARQTGIASDDQTSGTIKAILKF